MPQALCFGSLVPQDKDLHTYMSLVVAAGYGLISSAQAVSKGFLSGISVTPYTAYTTQDRIS